MPEESQHLRDSLVTLHRKTGEVLIACYRLLATMTILGALFFMMTLTSFQLMQHPEQTFRIQGFSFNYSEFASTTSNAHSLANQGKPTDKLKKDPSWDGFIAGLGIGASIGQAFPLVGHIVGPVVGALVAYQLDERI